jgi:hypothetical protein
MLGCVQASIAKALHGRAISSREIPSPSSSPGSRAYRTLVRAGKKNIEFAADTIFVASGRTEITLNTLAPLSWAKVVEQSQTVLANELYSRISA